MDLRAVNIIQFLALVLLGSSKAQLTADRQKGAYIGKIKTLQHEVSGTLWAVDEDTLYIEDFHYDGIGPDAFFWVGNGSQPTPQGVIVPYPSNSYNGKPQKQLPRFTGKNVILHLPRIKLKDINWFSVWCRRFTMDFGHILIPSNLRTPKTIQLNEFSRLGHSVRSGNVTILDARTFYIPNLHYDGAGPDAFFWVGTGYEPNQLGQKVPNEVGSLDVLRGYEGEDIEIQLPDNLTVYDIDYLSIWCVEYRHNFGHVVIPRGKDLWVPPALGQTRLKPISWYTTAEDLTEFGNCRQFSENLHVEWTARENDVKIRLVGRIADNEYMSFGLSGTENKPEMLNSDIVVAYYDSRDNSYHAVDYTVTARSQCTKDIGVCPDEQIQGGVNDVQVINGVKEDGITAITFTRPYDSDDVMDIPISKSNKEVVVIAAIGALNSRMQANYHDFFTKDKITLDFKSVGHNTCNFKTSPKRTYTYKPWPVNKISGVFNFTVDIGPTGGDRGYKAITNSSPWGIAWWINGQLIPEIYVERGQTYYFTIEGGYDDNNPSIYHPFYISSDKEGGYRQKTRDEQRNEVVHSGVAFTKMGMPYPTAKGRLCEWKHRGIDSWRESETFREYKRTLHRRCEPGLPGSLVWTVQQDTPDLVYYQCYTHPNLGWKIHVTDQGVSSPQSGSMKTSPQSTLTGFLVVTLVTYFSSFSLHR